MGLLKVTGMLTLDKHAAAQFSLSITKEIPSIAIVLSWQQIFQNLARQTETVCMARYQQVYKKKYCLL